MSMTLGEIMTRDVVTVDLDDTLERVRDIFDMHHFHHVLVTSAGRLAGVLSDRDLLKNISPFIGNIRMERTQDLNTLNRRVHQVMRRRPIVGTSQMSVRDAATLVLESEVSCLPVVNPRHVPIGIVTWRDLLRYCRFCDETGCEAA